MQHAGAMVLDGFYGLCYPIDAERSLRGSCNKVALVGIPLSSAVSRCPGAHLANFCCTAVCLQSLHQFWSGCWVKWVGLERNSVRRSDDVVVSWDKGAMRRFHGQQK